MWTLRSLSSQTRWDMHANESEVGVVVVVVLLLHVTTLGVQHMRLKARRWSSSHTLYWKLKVASLEA